MLLSKKMNHLHDFLKHSYLLRELERALVSFHIINFKILEILFSP